MAATFPIDITVGWQGRHRVHEMESSYLDRVRTGCALASAGYVHIRERPAPFTEFRSRQAHAPNGSGRIVAALGSDIEIRRCRAMNHGNVDAFIPTGSLTPSAQRWWSSLESDKAQPINPVSARSEFRPTRDQRWQGKNGIV